MNQPIRLEDAFCKALEFESATERQEYVDQIGQAAPELKEQLERLLSAHYSDSSAIEPPGHVSPAGAQATTPYEADRPGQETEDPVQIGPYKLLQQIGQGGMGVVYMAEQQHPVRRKVALKIIKPGMDSAQVLARFEAERQALALMDHPNIARVLDAGTTAQGRPYFVMELVRGVSIAKYCDEQQLDIRERLRLFVQVCRAIQHAHQKGIIHRDIKPSNVLIASFDGHPVPKVIDFGVAKAIGQQLTERTLFTGFGNVIGTLEYMSPEQAEFNSLDVDTRSDVYSLGVLLYELLTGSTPFTRTELARAGLGEVLRTIREVEPPLPSTRLSQSEALPSISAQRKAEPQSLMRSLRGELDWVVMRALEKNRNSRYESASALALDIERFLSDEKVEACPPSKIYALRKFARKHRQALVSLSAFIVLMCLAVIVSIWQAMTADRLRLEAQTALAEAEAARSEMDSQRQKAVGAETQAQANAEEARQAAARAQANAERIAEHLYDADIKWAQVALERHDPVLAQEYLDRHLPVKDAQDLRDFEWHHLAHRLNRDQLTIQLPGKAVQLMSFNEPGTELIAASDHRLTVYRPGTGKVLRTIYESEPVITRAAYSPSAQLIALGLDGGTVRVVDAQTGQLRLSLPAQAAPQTLLSMASDGSSILSSGEDNSLRLWDTKTGEEVQRLGNVERPVTAAAHSRDGRLVAAVVGEGPISLWDVTGKLLGTLETEGARIDGVTFLHDGKTLAASTSVRREHCIQLWNIETQKPSRALAVGSQRITALGLSNSGKLAASCDENRVVRVWDIETGRQLNAFEGHWGIVRALAFSPDETRLASMGAENDWAADSEHCIRLWDLSTQPEPMVLEGVSYAVDFSADGRLLLSYGLNGTPLLFDATSGEVIRSTTEEIGDTAALAFHPDGKTFASGSWNGEVSIWNVEDGKRLKRLPSAKNWVRQVRFSPDGKQLAVAGLAGLRVYDVATASTQPEYEDPSVNSTHSIAFDRREPLLFTASESRLTVWDTNTKQAIRQVQAHDDTLRAIAVHPSEPEIATCSDDHTIKRWDTRTWQLLSTWRGHRAQVTCLAYNATGTRLASGGFDEVVNVWDVHTGQQVLTFTDHNAILFALAFSPDGTQLASASGSGSVVIRRAPIEPRQR